MWHKKSLRSGATLFAPDLLFPPTTLNCHPSTSVFGGLGVTVRGVWADLGVTGGGQTVFMANSEWRNDLYRLAAGQHGAVELSQTSGLAATQASRLRELNGSGWEAPVPTVRVRKGAPRTRELAAAVALLQLGPLAALSHRSAAAWWDLPGFSLDPFDVIRRHGSSTTRAGSGVQLRETRRLPEKHITVQKGLRVTRPERLPFDLMYLYGPQKIEVLVDRILHRRLASPSRMHQMLKELGGRGAKGIGDLRDIMAARPAGYVPPESGAESRMLWLSRRYGLPEFRLQVNLGSANEWVARVDFVCEERLVLWVQSEAYHSALVDRRKDAAQRTKLLAEGFKVVEVWQHELWDKPEVVVQRIRDHLTELSPRNFGFWG